MIISMDLVFNEEIERLYIQKYKLLFHYAKSALESPELAEEAVQETFRIACEKAEDLHRSENPQGWLFVTLKYVIANKIRTRNAASKLLSEVISAKLDANPDNELPLELIYEDLAQTDAFCLIKEIAIEGLSYTEMARKRNISYYACKQRVFRAKQFLQEKIKKIEE